MEAIFIWSTASLPINLAKIEISGPPWKSSLNLPRRCKSGTVGSMIICLFIFRWKQTLWNFELIQKIYIKTIFCRQSTKIFYPWVTLTYKDLYKAFRMTSKQTQTSHHTFQLHQTVLEAHQKEISGLLCNDLDLKDCRQC